MEKTGGLGFGLFTPEIVSLGGGSAGGMRPSLIQESCDRSETLSTLVLLDHDVDPISSSNSSNGVASPSDHNAVIQRSPEITILSSTQENLAVLDDDKVDTSLSLSTPGSSNEKSPQKRGRSAGDDDDQDRNKKMFKKVAGDDASGAVNTALRLSVYSYFQTDRVETLSYPTVLDVEVDTNFISRNYVSTSPVPPLRWVLLDFSNDDEVDTTLNLRPPGSTNKKSTKRRELIKKRYNKKKAVDDEDEGPLVPIEEIHGLFETLLSRTGTRPVFLYRKKLQESDVKGDQNRLFVTNRERLMGFLTEEEVAAVDGGLKVVGIDGGGNEYKKLGLKRWTSLNMVVINSDWRKVVVANNAKKDDVVEIWGYRENGKACLAFNFRREREMEPASSR